MELTVNNALLKGIEAHKAGKVQEADRYYTAILKAQPNHPDANHNMGVLAVSLGKVKEALPFFQKALKSNPKIEQYWLSYINSLIELKLINEAEILVRKAKNIGVSNSLLTKLNKILDLNIRKKISSNQVSEIDITNKINYIMDLLNKGYKKKALNTNTDLLRKYPNSAPLYNSLGLIYARENQFDAALNSYKKALSINPELATTYANLGNLFCSNYNLKKGIEHYKKALKILPNSALIYFNLANAQSQSNDFIISIKNYLNAIKLKPGFPEAHLNLGNVFRKIGDFDKALENYKITINSKPNYVEAYINSSNILIEKREFDEALLNLKKAIEINPNSAQAYNSFGNFFKNIGKIEIAQEHYKKALEIKPNYEEANMNMGNIQRDLGDLDKALLYYNKALKINPDNSISLHMVNSLSGQISCSPPREYVEKLFDQSAKSFEELLVNKLKYKVPKIIYEMIINQNKHNSSLGSVLDMGCGTGLMGLELKKKCKFLEGIDISKSMVEEARAKQVYNKLKYTDLVEYLSIEYLDFDLFIATDVFVYLGELSEIFRLIKHRNRRNGQLAFSIEKSVEKKFFLEKSGRYSHSKGYIKQLCEKFDYSILNYKEVKLRKENDKYLNGALYILEF